MSKGMPTGKSLGWAKGDWALTGPGWVAHIVSNVHTYAPMCEVWGVEHECGSVYATNLGPRLTEDEARERIVKLGFDPSKIYVKVK